MVPLSALLLPIFVAAVIVFVASSIMHMILPYHHSDCKQLPDEDKILGVMRTAGVKRGLYMFPFCSHKNMKSPEIMEKFKQGPAGMMTVFPPGPPAMPKFLIQWFLYCIVVGIFVAYLTGRTVPPGTPYLRVHQIAGCAAFMAYGLGNLANGIWKAQPWSVVLKEVFDGLVYGALTGGTFGWLWPR
jgi:hypothetical protein